MRIAFVLTQDLESPSGLGRYFPLARQLFRLGNQVSISATHPDYHTLRSKKLSLEGVDVHYVAPMHVQKQGNLKYYYGTLGLISVVTRATLRLGIDILRAKADIIHVGKPHPMNSVAGIIGKSLSHAMLCVDCDDYEAGSMQFSAKWQEWFIAQFEQRVPKVARLVTVNTYYMRQKLIDWGIPEQKVLYLPNGVDKDRFFQSEPEKIEELRFSLGLKGKQVVAYFGSMSLPSHPVDLLVNAFSIVLQKSPETRLLLVGGGGDYPALVEMVQKMGLSDAVIFTGRVDPCEISKYYRIADISVDPVHDNDAARGRLPLKLFESWASGVPFVTSMVGDRTSLLEDTHAGLLTKVCTAESYAEAILEILSSPSLADKLRTRGVVEVQKYTWEHLAERLHQAYQGLMDKDQKR